MCSQCMCAIYLTIFFTLHGLISASVDRRVIADPAELPIVPGRKMVSTDAVEYNLQASKGKKTPVFVRYVIKIQQIYVFPTHDY